MAGNPFSILSYTPSKRNILLAGNETGQQGPAKYEHIKLRLMGEENVASITRLLHGQPTKILPKYAEKGRF